MRPPSSSSSPYSICALAALLVAACSDDGTSARPLDCTWLAGNNCWRTTAALAADCLPSPPAFGTFDATGTVCTYPDGTTITFDQPLTLPISPDATPLWRFTVANGATTCLRYERTETERTLTVSGQTYSDSPSGSYGVQVSCPDGTIYATDDESTLSSCPGAFTRIPNEAWASNVNSATLELVGAGPDGGELPIFDCRRP